MSKGTDMDFEQDIELFFYRLANGTLFLKHPKIENTDYRKILVQNREVFKQASYLFLNALFNTSNSQSIYREVFEFIIQTNSEISKCNYPPSSPLDSLSKLITQITLLPDLTYNRLFLVGNDLQLAMCIWANNLKLDSSGLVTNGEYSIKRSIDFLNHNVGEFPLNKLYEDWELEHHT